MQETDPGLIFFVSTMGVGVLMFIAMTVYIVYKKPEFQKRMEEELANRELSS